MSDCCLVFWETQPTCRTILVRCMVLCVIEELLRLPCNNVLTDLEPFSCPGCLVSFYTVSSYLPVKIVRGCFAKMLTISWWSSIVAVLLALNWSIRGVLSGLALPDLILDTHKEASSREGFTTSGSPTISDRSTSDWPGLWFQVVLPRHPVAVA